MVVVEADANRRCRREQLKCARASRGCTCRSSARSSSTQIARPCVATISRRRGPAGRAPRRSAGCAAAAASCRHRRSDEDAALVAGIEQARTDRVGRTTVTKCPAGRPRVIASSSGRRRECGRRAARNRRPAGRRPRHRPLPGSATDRSMLAILLHGRIAGSSRVAPSGAAVAGDGERAVVGAGPDL